MFSLQVDQLHTNSQRKRIEEIATSVAPTKCRFLEVGSWIGDSSVILGKVAKKYGGILYCVDWWQGSDGTELAEIAERENIFELFWKRVKEHDLQDVIIPIKGKSSDVIHALKEQTFDLVFIDGDHRYDGVIADIEDYSPLVRDGGVLVGHDCEGFATDFDQEFLAANKNLDQVEGVHCGVVSAVGECFDNVTIEFGLWSVKRNGVTWEPRIDRLPLNEIHLPPPYLLTNGTHAVFRFLSNYYLAPVNSIFDSNDKLPPYEHLESDRDIKALKNRVGGNFSAPPNKLLEVDDLEVIKINSLFYCINKADDATRLGISERGGIINLDGAEAQPYQSLIEALKAAKSPEHFSSTPALRDLIELLENGDSTNLRLDGELFTLKRQLDDCKNELLATQNESEARSKRIVELELILSNQPVHLEASLVKSEQSNKERIRELETSLVELEHSKAERIRELEAALGKLEKAKSKRIRELEAALG